MTNFQRTIKYIAIAFAILLAVGIVSGIANAAFSIVSGISGGAIFSEKDSVDFSKSFTEVKSLDIDNSTGKLTIKAGNEFKVEAENVSSGFDARVTGNGTLKITDDNRFFQFLWFHIGSFNNPDSKITLYLPADFVSEDAKIESGAGSVSVESLQSEKLDISAGAGNITGGNITADKVKIDGGIGSVTLNHVNFNDSDFNCGVGSLDIEGVLTGKNKLDCGVGEVELHLTGNAADYDLDVDSGIGTVRVNGDRVRDGYKTDNNAPNSIKEDGGIGNVNIDIRQ
jgi:hypothetical protein